MTAGWIIAAVYISGVIGLLFPQTASIVKLLIWPVLLFTCFVLLSFHKKWTREFVFSVFLISSCGFLIEVAGVKTGYIFGYFQYGSSLGFKLWEVPLIMMAYWFTTIYISRQVAEMIAKDIFLISVLAASLMVLLDYFLEPFAVKYGLWSWNGGAVPVHNYIGWFISGLLMQYLYCKSIKIPANKLSLVIYLVQLGFFIALFLLRK